MKRRTVIALLLFCVAGAFLLYDFIGKKTSTSDDKKEYLRSEGVVFGTIYHVTYSNKDGIQLDDAITRALAVVDGSLSMFNNESTIARFNSGEMVGCDDVAFNYVVSKGMAISEATAGAFDMTVAPLVDLWGFGLKNRSNVTAEQVDSALMVVGYQYVDVTDGCVTLLRDGVSLDASAIAKGFACDVVLDTLKANGCTDACVEIGGEVAVCGLNPKNEHWRIGVNKPIDDSLSVVSEVYRVCELTDRAMATSGNYRNFYEQEGKRYSHTIDPKTGRPVQHTLLSATIIADNCMTADAWATACMVLGLDSARVLLTEQPELDVILIYDSLGVMKCWDNIDK